MEGKGGRAVERFKGKKGRNRKENREK